MTQTREEAANTPHAVRQFFIDENLKWAGEEIEMAYIMRRLNRLAIARILKVVGTAQAVKPV